MKLLISTSSLLFLITFSLCDAAPQVKFEPPAVILHQIARDKGHVVLVNFWATWCGSCVAEYPKLVTLNRRYRSQGLDVVAVSLDFGSGAQGKVQSFVQSHRADFPQYILQIDDLESAIDAFDLSWQGDLPRTFIYDRRGKRVATLAGPESLASFTHAVNAAMAAK